MKYVFFLGMLLVVVNSAGWFYYTAQTTENSSTNHPVGDKVQPDIVSVFIFTLQDEVRKKIGQPVEGYEPRMFLDVFPGLVETDFDGVDASIGMYVIENGRLVHKMGDAKLIHSAATAVTPRGMVALLDNVTIRLGVDLSEQGTLTDIMSALLSD